MIPRCVNTGSLTLGFGLISVGLPLFLLGFRGHIPWYSGGFSFSRAIGHVAYDARIGSHIRNKEARGLLMLPWESEIKNWKVR